MTTPQTSQLRGGIDVSDQQAAVVDHVLDNLVTVVGAGAGSGKTHTTVATVMQILDHRLANIDHFALITFTNDAANSLRERIEKTLRERLRVAVASERAFWLEQLERLPSAFIGTIHSLCREFLKSFGYEERVARESDVTVSSSLLSESIRDAVNDAVSGSGALLLGNDLTWEEYDIEKLAKNIYEAIRNRGLDAETILADTHLQPDDPGKASRLAMAELVADIDNRYTEAKARDQLLDSTDLLRRTARMLGSTAGGTITSIFAERCRYLFVDEFQDTDRTQKQIVDALLPGLRGLLVVGDRKQSIYGFRAADVSLLETIAIENDVKVLPMNVSRRPSMELLDLQNALFASIADRYPDLNEPLEPSGKALSQPATFPALRYISAGTGGVSRDTGAHVTYNAIQSYLQGQIADPKDGMVRPVQPSDIAVLVRTNYILDEYDAALRAMGLQVQKDQGGRFFEHPAIVSTYHMLRLLLRYPDEIALSLALRTPYLRGADASAEEQHLLTYGKAKGTPLFDWFASHYPEKIERLKELRTAVRMDTVPQILARLYTNFGIREFYLQTGDRLAADNLERLREVARGLFQEEQALTLRTFVGWMRMAYLTGREEQEADWATDSGEKNASAVRIQTIHRSKGLEYPIVIIPELQEALFKPFNAPRFMIAPGRGLDVSLREWGRATASGNFARLLDNSRGTQLEEEMRIFYVGLTRAERGICLIGSNPPQGRLAVQGNPTDSDRYSWQDEVFRARQTLENLGARFQ